MPLEPFANLVTMFLARAAAKGDAPFLWRKHEGAWQALSWQDVARRVAAVAEGLRGIGLRPGERVMLVAENRPDWLIADLAIMAAGGVTVPAYLTNTAADHRHILVNSGAAMAIVSTARLARPLVEAMAEAPTVRALVAMEPIGSPPPDAAVHDWTALLAYPADLAAVTARAAAIGPDDLACIIHTSGTGGAPRGVRQHHGAILHNARATMAIVEQDFGVGDDEALLSFLPLSHAYEHSAGQFLPIAAGAQIYYAEGLEKLAANIEEVRPTIMIVVPRLFELLRARTLKAVAGQGRLAQALFARAVADDRPGWLLDRLLDRTVRAKVRRRFGGRLKALVSGGAPLQPDAGAFFERLGLTLLQGYGQTEAGPIISCNRPRAGIALATVGPPLDEVEVRIAADGEILVRGPNVMHGYWNDEAESARALADGWLHTGDVGHLDGVGRIVITDRKKDIIVSDKGENIAPQRIEGLLTLQPEIAQAMVAGDRRPYLVAVIVPAEAEARAAVDRAVARVNAGLAPVERVRRFILADEPFSTENGELTPSLKVRRHKVRARYGARLDALYGGAGTGE